MSDEPLTRAELAELKRLRIGKPASRALPADAYRDQEAVAKYERERAKNKHVRGGNN